MVKGDKNERWSKVAVHFRWHRKRIFRYIYNKKKQIKC